MKCKGCKNIIDSIEEDYFMCCNPKHDHFFCLNCGCKSIDEVKRTCSLLVVPSDLKFIKFLSRVIEDGYCLDTHLKHELYLKERRYFG